MVLSTLVSMAGTLSYSVRARHVFQRKFADPESFSKALSSCRWYIITRRPSVRIVSESVRLDDNIITLDAVTRDSLDSDRRAHHLAADLALAGTAKAFEVYANGAYFSALIDDQLIHGDAWALASLLCHARPDIARQEVLYIGQAANVWERIQSHKKLQRIYEDHAGDDWDIFVAPLVLEKRSWSTEDHIDDADDGPDIAAYYEKFAVHAEGILKPSIDLIEHSLISYFRPRYNELLKEWPPSNPTDAMRKMQSARFRLLHVHMNGWMGLARFYSHQEPEPIRSHFISHDIPPKPRRPSLRGISAPQLSEWRIDARLVEDGRVIFANLAEYSGVELNVFGDKAPAVRVPPEVALPSIDGLQSNSTVLPRDTSTLGSLNQSEAMRLQIKEDREALRKASEPLLHPGASSYDPSTGSIITGQYDDDREATWRLHGLEGSGVGHGLIIGDRQMGKSNGLWIIMLEAALSGVFIVIPADPRNEHNFLDRLRSAAPRRWDARPGRGLHHIRSLLRLTSTNKPIVGDRPWLNSKSFSETIDNLRTVCQVVDALAARGEYTLPTRRKPGILLAIDDADEILHDASGSEMVEKILVEGGRVGVGVVVVVRDLASLGGSSLIRSLVSVENRCVFMQQDAYYRFMDLYATYGPRRASTMSKHAVTFVLHWGAREVTLGRLLNVGDPALTPDEAQNWANETLSSGRDRPLMVWEMFDEEDARSWWSLDVEFVLFFLRRHPDGWALLRNVSRAPGTATQIEALKWADGVLATKFNVEPKHWILGPTTGEPGLLALYANASNEPVAKPFPLDAYLRWQY
jgi:hypothetical protein